MTTRRDDDARYDLSRLRPTPEDVEAHAAARRALKKTRGAATGSKLIGRGPFVQYPVEAIIRLARAKHRGTVKLFGWLLHLSWKADHRLPLRLANKTVAPLGLSRWGKGAALRELEALGLIRVERQDRRSPLVTAIAHRKGGVSE